MKRRFIFTVICSDPTIKPTYRRQWAAENFISKMKHAKPEISWWCIRRESAAGRCVTWGV